MSDIDFKFIDDPEGAVIRASRSIVQMLQAALESLRARGILDRELDIKVEDDGTHNILKGGVVVYKVELIHDTENSGVQITGRWTS